MNIFAPENVYFGVYIIPVMYKLEKLCRNTKLNKLLLFLKNQYKILN